MSDYPRPPASPSPRPFLLDRIVGGVGFLYFGLSAVWWLVSLLRDANARTFFQNNPYYIPSYLSLLLFFLWGFLLVYRGRRGGFLIAAIFLSFTLIGAFYLRRLGSSVPYFVVWIYCVARLFRLIDPKPVAHL